MRQSLGAIVRACLTALCVCLCVSYTLGRQLGQHDLKCYLPIIKDGVVTGFASDPDDRDAVEACLSSNAG